MKKTNPRTAITCFGLAAIALGLTLPSASAQVTYDLSNDFSLASNPGGVWSYGGEARLGGTFDLFTVSRTVSADNGVSLKVWQLVPYLEPTILYNGTTQTATSDGGAGVYAPGAVLLISGTDGAADGYCVARFTAPLAGAGTYKLSCSAHSYLSGPLSGDTDFHVIKNGSELFGQFLAGNSSTGFSAFLDLAPGDTVDFIVGRGADGSGSWSGLQMGATLTLVPEPSVCGLLLIGGALFALRNRFNKGS